MNGRESAVIGTGPVTRGTGENWGGAVCANAVFPTSKTSKARRQVRMRLTARRCPSARGLRVIVNRFVTAAARLRPLRGIERIDHSPTDTAIVRHAHDGLPVRRLRCGALSIHVQLAVRQIDPNLGPVALRAGGRE